MSIPNSVTRFPRYDFVHAVTLVELALRVHEILDEAPVYIPVGTPFYAEHEWNQAIYK